MKRIPALVSIAICATAMNIACQKSGGGSSDPATQTYVFSGQQDVLNGAYSLNGFVRNQATNTSSNQTCSTGTIAFGSRTQFCTIIRDEVRNNNCAPEQRQTMFQQYCLNATTAFVPPTSATVPTVTVTGQLPVVPPVGNTPSVVATPPTGGGLGAGNSRLVTCTVTREKNGSVLVTSKTNVQTKIWNTTEASSMVFPKSLFANSGEAKVSLIPKSGKDHAKMQILFSKKSASDKSQTKTASIEASVHAVVYLTIADDEDQRESTISCSVMNGQTANSATAGQSAATAAGKTLNCEGSGMNASGEKFKITQNYPWNNKNIIETIPLGTEAISDLILSVNPGLGGQPAQISVEIPRGDHDMDYKAFGPLTHSAVSFQQREQNSAFRLDLRCQLLP